MPEELKLELLPCPNICCKSDPSMRSSGRVEGKRYFVVTCAFCEWVVGSGAKATKAEAATDWNTRPVSELERMAREVAKLYGLWGSSSEERHQRPSLHKALDAMAAYFAGPSQKGKQE